MFALRLRCVLVSDVAKVEAAIERTRRRYMPRRAATPAIQEIEDVMPLPASLLGSGEFFMLRVTGQSMRDAGIQDGDYVVVRKQDDATPGSIVAALIEDEATVKTLVRQGSKTVLRP